MERRGILLPVLEANCHYGKPAHYDDLIIVHTHCARIEGIRLRIEYEIRRAEAGDGQPLTADEVLATGYTQHACMSPSGKVLRLAPELVKLVEGQANHG
jgi:acyl-CoA thioester hydrolase